MPIVDYKKILQIDSLLENLESEISISMSFMKRTYGISYEELDDRMLGINLSTIKRYFQPSYHSVRPLHFLAALSWILMVPATAFYKGMKSKETFRGMDTESIEALVYVGKLPFEQFETVLDLVTNTMDSASRVKFKKFREDNWVEGIEDNFDGLLPPETLDMDLFAMDYYRSIAITMQEFRIRNDLSIEKMALVLGMSEYSYQSLEDPNKTVNFPISLGIRTKLGFSQSSHVEFTREMKVYPEFHQLRRIQHRRDVLIVEAMRLLPDIRKSWFSNVLKEITSLYR